MILCIYNKLFCHTAVSKLEFATCAIFDYRIYLIFLPSIKYITDKHKIFRILNFSYLSENP